LQARRRQAAGMRCGSACTPLQLVSCVRAHGALRPPALKFGARWKRHPQECYHGHAGRRPGGARGAAAGAAERGGAEEHRGERALRAGAAPAAAAPVRRGAVRLPMGPVKRSPA